jgi:uridylate kinase
MKTIILKLGGSIFLPEEINTIFLTKLKSTIEEYTSKGNRFIIIVGGGYTCRKYQNALKEVITPTNDTLDWLGIHATELNAQLLKLMFEGKASPEIITDPTKPVDKNSNIIIAAGYKPGWSTDYDAMLLSEQFEDKMIIVLSNIKNIYNKDPRKHPDATPYKNMTWKELSELVGDKWTPGLNTTMDQVAVKIGLKNQVRVVFADGRDIENFKKILNEKDFEGTIIE